MCDGRISELTVAVAEPKERRFPNRRGRLGKRPSLCLGSRHQLGDAPVVSLVAVTAGDGATGRYPGHTVASVKARSAATSRERSVQSNDPAYRRRPLGERDQRARNAPSSAMNGIKSPMIQAADLLACALEA